jgi:surfactin synthase thioesterase subunit
MFCFPHAAGNAAFYRPLRHAMPDGLDFCPIELPGRAARLGETPIADIDVLLDMLGRIIEPLMNVPFCFFGHSTGASVAYRATERLRSAGGGQATHLFVSARAAPAPTSPAGSDRAGRAQSLSDGELRTALRRFGGTPDVVLAREELIAVLLPAMRADLALGESCAGRGDPLGCPISAFGGENDAIDEASLKAWGELTRGSFRLRLFSGGHFYLTDAKEALAHEMVRDLHAILGPADVHGTEAR